MNRAVPLVGGEARCPVQAVCGGCPLLPEAAPAQEAIRRDAFERVFREEGIELQVPIAWQASPEPFGYRNRLRLRVDERGEPCFFNPAKVDACVVLAPGLLDAIAELRDAARAAPSLLAGFTHLEVRDRDALGRFGLRCVSSAVLGGGRRSAPELGARWLVGVTPCEPSEMPCQQWAVAEGVSVEVPLDAFLQVNGAVNRALVSHVVQGLELRGAREFADLFMGAGNFALPLLAAGLSGRGAERHVGAVAAARRVATARGWGGEGFIVGDALSIAERWLAEGVRLDAVLCDPPRAGLGPRAGAVAGLTRRWLVLCSCRPETLCADVRRLCSEGFGVDAVSLFDMFPQTRHVEAVVWLERG